MDVLLKYLLFIGVPGFFIYKFFKKSSDFDKITLLPLSEWMSRALVTPTEKERKKMCLALVYQALLILKAKHIYSPDDFLKISSTLGFNYVNFVQILLSTHLIESDFYSEQFVTEVESRLALSVIIASIIESEGEQGLVKIGKESHGPTQSWSNF